MTKPSKKYAEIEQVSDTLPGNWTATCECGWTGLLKECGQEEENEGWEYPSYMVAICPKCEGPVGY